YTYTRTKSQHLWKASATVNRVRERADVPDGFGGVYLFGSLADFLTSNPDQFRQVFGNPRVDFPVTSYGAFLQDHWSASSKLAIDLGLRYDFEYLPAGFNQDTNNFSPRVFDKTGTLTRGAPALFGVAPAAGTREAELLELPAGVEADSEHPVARA